MSGAGDQGEKIEFTFINKEFQKHQIWPIGVNVGYSFDDEEEDSWETLLTLNGNEDEFSMKPVNR